MQRPRTRSRAGFVLIATIMAGLCLRADTVTLRPVADTTLWAPNPDNNLGAGPLASGTTAGLSGGPFNTRSLIRFNPTNIPPHSTITSAKLTVRVTKVPASAVTSSFNLHKVLKDWGEGTGGGNTGAAAKTGNATWKARMFPTTLWAAPGAKAGEDYVATVSATKAMAGVNNYTFDTTAQMVADVQSWVDDSSSNFGWIMIAANEGAQRSAKRFGNREVINSGPSLVIEYTLAASDTPPSITQQPQEQTVLAGATVTFSVTATGTAPLSYQWRKAQTPITGATNSSLTLTNVTSADQGAYFCTVSNSAGQVGSTGGLLIVNEPPTITGQPQNQTVTSGGNANFSVSVQGSQPFFFQWRKNNVPVPGKTSQVLTLLSVQAADAGDYAAWVTNSFGSVTSAVATLTVSLGAPPTIISQPTSTTVIVGAQASLSVSAQGTAPLRYQWRKNGENIAGATNQFISIASATAADAGTYSVVVSNAAGTATSSDAVVTVMTPEPAAFLNKTLVKIADSTMSPPGGTGTFANFGEIALRNGHVVFSGNWRTAPDQVEFGAGIYEWTNGPLTKVIDKSAAIPSGTGNFTSFYSPTHRANDQIVFAGRGDNGQNGIYQIASGVTSRIFDTSLGIPGQPGEFFTRFGYPERENGIVAFLATKAIDVDEVFRGIYLSTGGNLTTVADRTTTLPGGDKKLKGGSAEVGFDGNTIAFWATDETDGQGIYAASGGVLRLIANKQSIMPGESGTFVSFSSPPKVVNDRVYFIGYAEGFKARFCYEDATGLHSVAKVGDSVPGRGVTFGSVSSFGVNNDGAFFGADTTDFANGVYYQAGGQILKAIDSFNTLDGKTVRRVGVGAASGTDLVLQVTFTDGVNALYLATGGNTTEPDTTPAFGGATIVDGKLQMSFIAKAGNNYTVEFISSLGGANWTTLTNIAAKLETANAIVSDSLSDNARFYRLNVTPIR